MVGLNKNYQSPFTGTPQLGRAAMPPRTPAPRAPASPVAPAGRTAPAGDTAPAGKTAPDNVTGNTTADAPTSAPATNTSQARPNSFLGSVWDTVTNAWTNAANWKNRNARPTRSEQLGQRFVAEKSRAGRVRDNAARSQAARDYHLLNTYRMNNTPVPQSLLDRINKTKERAQLVTEYGLNYNNPQAGQQTMYEQAAAPRQTVSPDAASQSVEDTAYGRNKKLGSLAWQQRKPFMQTPQAQPGFSAPFRARSPQPRAPELGRLGIAFRPRAQSLGRTYRQRPEKFIFGNRALKGSPQLGKIWRP